ncbi:MAG: hypothetical protein J0G33_03775 [Afipia felis]|nr:hypothetical protein [Afipia felis]
MSEIENPNRHTEEARREDGMLARSRAIIIERRRRLGIAAPDDTVLRGLAQMDEVDYQPPRRD